MIFCVQSGMVVVSVADVGSGGYWDSVCRMDVDIDMVNIFMD